MRNDGGYEVIKKAIDKLSIYSYLVTNFMTIRLNKPHGVANRGASVCVGRDTEKEGKG